MTTGDAGQPPDGTTATPWWRTAVLYQIYPRSFADSDGDGVGDLPGVLAHLDHIVALGVDAIWLSPFYPSPMVDFGYDHCDVDPLFGALGDAERLIAEAHARGLRVLVDFVPNHTSDRHPWFVASRSSREDPRRGWYVWRPPRPDGRPPNNWRGSFTGERIWERDPDGQLRPRNGVPPAPGTDVSAWTFDPATDEWYLHSFLVPQPDLNWRNPEVVDAMHDVLRFWLERGVDGFRIDALAALAKPADLADLPPELELRTGSDEHDDPVIHEHLRGIRRVVDEAPGDHLLLGEVQLEGDGRTLPYYGDGDELHLLFAFQTMYERWDAEAWRAQVDRVEAVTRLGHWPAWVLSNHDQPRHVERYGSEARARAAVVALCTLRGTPVLYAGEELGLRDAEVPDAARLDPGGRDGCRAPLPWTDTADHGWPGTTPWLPFPRNADTHDAARLERDPASILWLYRRLLAVRRATPALQVGGFTWLEAPTGVLAWERARPGDGPGRRVVAVNFTTGTVDVPVPGAWRVVVASDGPTGEGARYRGRLGPDQALVLAPEGAAPGATASTTAP
jgi:alpha-glucosidase